MLTDGAAKGLLVVTLAASAALAVSLRHLSAAHTARGSLVLAVAGGAVLSGLNAQLRFSAGTISGLGLLKAVATVLGSLLVAVQTLLGIGVPTRIAILAYLRLSLGFGPAGSDFLWLHIPSVAAIAMYAVCAYTPYKPSIVTFLAFAAALLASTVASDLYRLRLYLGLSTPTQWTYAAQWTRENYRNTVIAWILARLAAWREWAVQITLYDIPGALLAEFQHLITDWRTIVARIALAARSLRLQMVVWALTAQEHAGTLRNSEALRLPYTLSWLHTKVNVLIYQAKRDIDAFLLNVKSIELSPRLASLVTHAEPLGDWVRREFAQIVLESWNVLPEVEPVSLLYGLEVVLALWLTTGMLLAALKTYGAPPRAEEAKEEPEQEAEHIRSMKRLSYVVPTR